MRALGLVGMVLLAAACRSADPTRAPGDGSAPCTAYAAGGGCAQVVAGFVACGPRSCDARTSYCEIFLSDVAVPPTDYFCRPLPPSCLPGDGVARTCACFPPDTRCRAFCGPLPAGPEGATGFHLTCQGTRPPAE